jgi:hypothetical protein
LLPAYLRNTDGRSNTYLRNVTEILLRVIALRPPLWSSGQSSWLQIEGSIPGATEFSNPGPLDLYPGTLTTRPDRRSLKDI